MVSDLFNTLYKLSPTFGVASSPFQNTVDTTNNENYLKSQEKMNRNYVQLRSNIVNFKLFALKVR